MQSQRPPQRSYTSFMHFHTCVCVCVCVCACVRVCMRVCVSILGMQVWHGQGSNCNLLKFNDIALFLKQYVLPPFAPNFLV